MTSKGIIIQGPFYDKNEAKAQELADTLPEESVVRVSGKDLQCLSEREFVDCDPDTHMLIFENVNHFELLLSCYNVIIRGVVLPGLFPPVIIKPLLIFVIANDFPYERFCTTGLSFTERFLSHSVTISNEALKERQDNSKRQII